MTSRTLCLEPEDETFDGEMYLAYFGATRDVHLVGEGAVFGMVSSPSATAAPGSIGQAWHYTLWVAVISHDRDGSLCRAYRVVKDESGADMVRLLDKREVAFFRARWERLCE